MTQQCTIHLLTDDVCNQIAAGEVIQRPASVLKELLENSIDANSTEIKVIVEEGGKTLIQVIDNGIGMSEMDARMSLEKHATSKIKNTEDLYSIKTMGFRGEAIASIISVSQTEIITKIDDDNIGTKIVVEGSNVKSQEYVNTSKGTNFIVKNLFYNLPARRVFLKSTAIEFQYIKDEFERIALSRSDINFILIHNGQEIYNLRSGSLLNRISDIFGAFYKKKLISINDKNPFVGINGVIGDPSCAKNQKLQFLFVNNRFIKNKYLQNAITEAYSNFIQKDKNPFYVIFFTIPPETIDVNIHPSKTEIKMHNEDLIYEFTKSVVKKALTKDNIPEIDFSNSEQISFDNLVCENKKINDTFDTENNECLNIQANSSIDYSENKIFADDYIETKTSFIQIKPSYIITNIKSGLLIIDFHLASIRILYERYLQQFEKDIYGSQQLLFPVFLKIPIKTFNYVKENILFFNKIGFQIEFKNKDEIIVLSCPNNLNEENLKDFFMDDFDKINCENNKTELALRLARINSLKSNKTFSSSKEMQSVIDKLFLCNEQNFTPRGEKIWTLLKIEDIANLLS